jgi:pyruvate dehydrogenase E1 component
VGAGCILAEVMAAAVLLERDFGVPCEVWSATSFSELAREARGVQRRRRLARGAPVEPSHVERCLAGPAPVVIASDYVRAVPQLIAEYVDAPLVTLGTDGFGRSDTRAAVRRFFEVDRQHVVVAALDALARQGRVAEVVVRDAITRFGLGAGSPPWEL